MDHVSARDATYEGLRGRRRRMRDRARAQHPMRSAPADRYQTPAWLERSFVLPLTPPEASDVPTQPVPHHDDDPVTEACVTEHADTLANEPATAEGFVRPPSDEIDFALVVRRADLARRATRVHWVATALAGLALLGFLLLGATVLLDGVVVLALLAVAAFVVRLRLSRAPIPRLQR